MTLDIFNNKVCDRCQTNRVHETIDGEELCEVCIKDNEKAIKTLKKHKHAL